VRQSGADHDERRALLGQLVAGRAQRRDIVGQQVLHLVDEDRDALAGVGGQSRDIAQQLDQVDLDVPRVGPPADHRHVDARLPPRRRLAGPLRGRGLALREGLQHAEDVPLTVLVRAGQLADRQVQRRRQRMPQRLVGPGLELAGTPTATYSRAAHRVEQHRLADAAQSDQHDGPFRAAPRHAFEHHVERLQLGIASGQLGRTLPRTGGVRIADRIHDRTVSSYLANPRDLPRFRNRVAPGQWQCRMCGR
jgi:hypothetical protein